MATTPNTNTETKPEKKPLRKFEGELKISFKQPQPHELTFTPFEIVNGTEYLKFPFLDIVNPLTLEGMGVILGEEFACNLLKDALREHCLRKWRQVADSVVAKPEELFAKLFFIRDSKGTLTSLTIQKLANLKLQEAKVLRDVKKDQKAFLEAMTEYQNLVKQVGMLMMEEHRQGIVVEEKEENEDE